jgi:DDE superfamily endonuclease
MPVADIGNFTIALGDIARSLVAIEEQAVHIKHLVALGGDHGITLPLLSRASKEARSARIDPFRCACRYLAGELRPDLCSWLHKAAGVRVAIEARGATLRYLPKYSPDLNPIEMPFSKLKAYLRKTAERTIPRLRRRIGSFARNLTAREAANYFRHAGYA